jgi:hypothetical protein
VSIKRPVFEDAMVGILVKKYQIARPGQVTHWIRGSLKGEEGLNCRLKYNRTD